MRSWITAVGVAGVAVAVSGCGTPAVSPQPDTDASLTTTMRMPRYVDNSDRPRVTFDPCLDIPDSALIEAGYDPASEENADFKGGSYTFLGCSYDTPERRYGMNVLSGNVSFAEEQEKSSAFATPIEINGRRALLKFNPAVRNACDLSIETSDGFLGFTRRLVVDYAGPAPEPEWCAGLEDTARIFERYIPKES
ncbi:DUF3558 domain-containing protein [Rhodococcus koreensis]